MKARFSWCFLTCLWALPLAPSEAAPRQAKRLRLSILGKWCVISGRGSELKDHTYNFLSGSTCIEKYRSDQMVGPVDEPPQSAEVEIVITYRYKAIREGRYRFYPVKSLAGGQDTHWARAWHVLDVAITKDKAIASVVERQKTQVDKIFDGMADAAAGSKAGRKSADALKAERQVWQRVAQ